jgi:hypothetical protein
MEAQHTLRADFRLRAKADQDTSNPALAFFMAAAARPAREYLRQHLIPSHLVSVRVFATGHVVTSSRLGRAEVVSTGSSTTATPISPSCW